MINQEENLNIFYARKDKVTGKNYQTLDNHLEEVIKISASFSQYPNTSKLAGLLHDFGKATTAFQEYLQNDEGKRGSVVHAVQGALLLDELNVKNDLQSVILKEILELAIIGHHNSLNDCVSPDGEEVFFDKLKNKDGIRYNYRETKANFEEIRKDYLSEINILFAAAKTEITDIFNKIEETYKRIESRKFAKGLLAKYIYSCLVDADRCDAYSFETEEPYELPRYEWDGLIKAFEDKSLEKFAEKKSEISKIRADISEKCKNAANKDTDIYQLSVPTGGGKTLSSLRFALYHAKENNKKRIIYVIPYLSIIEQTAENVREILNLEKDSETLLEHHSNIIAPDDSEEMNLRKLATARWEKQIIITTMVQFLETVMSSRAGDLRKFHNMQDSVIIFDEIQSLPIHSIHLFNETVSFLSKILNSTVLLCTATQPLIGKTRKRNLLLADESNLIGDVNEEFKRLKRVNIVVVGGKKDSGEFARFAFDKANEEGNCLVVVNTKKSAKNIFEKIKDFDIDKSFEIYHLSTSMCLAHRAEVFKKVKECLKKSRRVICVSTPLIEAGVDISFECVVRATAGLDSIAQAAGRCNRNGDSLIPRNVYVCHLKDENLDNLFDIKSGKEKSERVIRENPDADYLSQNILDEFYGYFFYQQENIMDFPVTKYTSSIYAFLSGNKAGTENYKNRTGKNYDRFLSQAFETASCEYKVIANDTETVVVYYGEAKELIGQYRNTYQTKEKLSILKKLEKYGVSLYGKTEFRTLNDKCAISILDDEFGVKVLNDGYYSDETGVTMEIDVKKLIP